MQQKYFWSAAATIAIAGATCSTRVVAEEAKPQLATPSTTTANTQLAGPVIEGHKFVLPSSNLREPNTREARKTWELLTTSASVERGASPTAKSGMPTADASTPRERGSTINPAYLNSATYYGLGSIFQYTNDGAPDKNRACGQAAIATILTYYGIKPRDTGYSVIREVYRNYPPDIAWGILGTSYQQMERALRGYGVPFNWYSGESGLRNALKLNKPCLVMLDVGAMPGEGWGWGGHWVVAYGYDNSNIYFTNWNPSSSGQWDGGKCTWDNFRKGWNGQLSVANGTRGMFICPKG